MTLSKFNKLLCIYLLFYTPKEQYYDQRCYWHIFLYHYDILICSAGCSLSDYCSMKPSYSIWFSYFRINIWQLSPPDLLNSRDKFRQAPPPNLPQSRYGEIEAYFGGLITLYHIRKLLSSHGIRPAYEMLEEKLKQGYFLVDSPLQHCL